MCVILQDSCWVVHIPFVRKVKFIIIIIIIILLLLEFFTPVLVVISHWSLSDNKSPQVPRILISILVDLNNTVVYMVCTSPFIFKSSSSFINPLGIFPSAPVAFGISVTFMFYGFFKSLARSWYLSIFSLYFNLTLCYAGTSKLTDSVVVVVVDYH